MVYYRARLYFTPKISIKSFLIHIINILSNLPCSLPHQNTPLFIVVTPLNFIPHIADTFVLLILFTELNPISSHL